MAKSTFIDPQNLFQKIVHYLAQSGPRTAQEICKHLSISQPTFSRVAAQNAGDLLRIGQSRNTQYTVLRKFVEWGSPNIPIFSIDEKGTLSQVAILYPLSPKGYYLESKTSSFKSRYYEGLPYFFEDLRPAGFLGRLIPRLYPDLALPDDTHHWNETQTLTYLTRHGWDLIGNLIVGENSYEAYVRTKISGLDVLPERNRSKRYPILADLVLSQGIPGSSAAGEQPKFLSILETKNGLMPVLVKFSPPGLDGDNDKIGQRIADLLVCEHLSHAVLRSHGHNAPRSRLTIGQNRLFLEMERFDRNTKGGRIGLVSLRALDLEFVGQLRSWTETAESLWKQKIIDHSTYQRIVWLEVFGKLIGNTDRHHGNISFFCEGEKVTNLAPVYDMLPMMYAPQQNQLVERPFNPAPPKSAEISVWNSALAAAKDFWKQVQKHPRISKGFTQQTSYHETILSKLPLL